MGLTENEIIKFIQKKKSARISYVWVEQIKTKKVIHSQSSCMLFNFRRAGLACAWAFGDELFCMYVSYSGTK